MLNHVLQLFFKVHTSHQSFPSSLAPGEWRTDHTEAEADGEMVTRNCLQLINRYIVADFFKNG
jgi:hypothetical protein